jgi:Flp pilus assembly protein TadB
MTPVLARTAALSARLLAALLIMLVPGAYAAATATAADAPAGSPPRVVVILMDVHTLTPPRLIAAEHAGVLAYARALPPDVRAGLIIFSDGFHVALRPTTSRGRLAAAVAATQQSGDTSNGLYPALEAAEAVVSRLHAAARARLLVFSDAETLTGGAPTASLRTDVVLWRLDADDRPGLLRAFARASHGRVVPPARAASLAAEFPPLAPATPANAPTGHPAASAAAHPAPAPATRLSWPLTAALAAVFAALFLLAMLAISSLRQRDIRRDLADRIERYGPQHASAAPEADGKVASTAVGWMRQLLRSSNTEPQLARRLDLAGINRQPAEWALLGVCASVALAAVLTVLTRSLVVGVLVGGLTGWLGMRLTLSVRIGRRRAAFSEQLPDVLQLVAGSLQSGFSLQQALDAVVREDTQPTSGEFSRALAEARIGANVEDALESVANRMQSTDFRWTVMAIRIQRMVGGNLAEVLHNVVGTMRERAYLRRQVRALSAEGRLSAYILVALPVAVGGWLFFRDPAYMRPLYTTPMGLLMLTGTAVLLVIGGLWMRAVIKVEV